MNYIKKIIAAASLTLGVCGSANADTVYTYTGNPFTTVNDASLGSSLTMSFSFDISNNYTGSAAISNITNYTVSTNTLSFNQNNSNLTDLSSFDFNNGVITGWTLVFDAARANSGGDFLIYSNFDDEDAIFNNTVLNDYNSTGVFGTWSQQTAVTPLPATWSMMLAGFALFGFVKYRRTTKGRI